MLRHIVSESSGSLWLTTDLAEWIVKVCSADDTLPAKWAWIFALAYQGAKLRGDEDTRCLDLALMTRAWEHPTALQPVVLRPLWPEISHLFPEPEKPSLDETCQRMGRGRQWVDLASGQKMLDEEITGVSSDLPPWADDEASLVDDIQRWASKGWGITSGDDPQDKTPCRLLPLAIGAKDGEPHLWAYRIDREEGGDRYGCFNIADLGWVGPLPGEIAIPDDPPAPDACFDIVLWRRGT